MLKGLLAGQVKKNYRFVIFPYFLMVSIIHYIRKFFLPYDKVAIDRSMIVKRLFCYIDRFEKGHNRGILAF